MVTQVSPNLYRIPVPLPGNPLKNLNAYLIRGHRNLLVDTGFRQEECRTALKAGLAELGVDMANTDIFLTHLHSDHAGLAPELLRPTSRLFIGDVDRQRLPGQIPSTDNARWGEFDALMAAQGFPLELLNQLTHTIPLGYWLRSPVTGTRACSMGTPSTTAATTSKPWTRRDTRRGTWCCGRNIMASCC